MTKFKFIRDDLTLQEIDKELDEIYWKYDARAKLARKRAKEAFKRKDMVRHRRLNVIALNLEMILADLFELCIPF